jgi:hypothetical protein
MRLTPFSWFTRPMRERLTIELEVTSHHLLDAQTDLEWAQARVTALRAHIDRIKAAQAALKESRNE